MVAGKNSTWDPNVNIQPDGEADRQNRWGQAFSFGMVDVTDCQGREEGGGEERGLPGKLTVSQSDQSTID